jgi:hypothetical protein
MATLHLGEGYSIRREENVVKISSFAVDVAHQVVPVNLLPNDGLQVD